MKLLVKVIEFNLEFFFYKKKLKKFFGKKCYVGENPVFVFFYKKN